MWFVYYTRTEASVYIQLVDKGRHSRCPPGDKIYTRIEERGNTGSSPVFHMKKTKTPKHPSFPHASSQSNPSHPIQSNPILVVPYPTLPYPTQSRPPDKATLLLLFAPFSKYHIFSLLETGVKQTKRRQVAVEIEQLRGRADEVVRDLARHAEEAILEDPVLGIEPLRHLAREGVDLARVAVGARDLRHDDGDAVGVVLAPDVGLGGGDLVAGGGALRRVEVDAQVVGLLVGAQVRHELLEPGGAGRVARGRGPHELGAVLGAQRREAPAPRVGGVGGRDALALGLVEEVHGRRGHARLLLRRQRPRELPPRVAAEAVQHPRHRLEGHRHLGRLPPLPVHDRRDLRRRPERRRRALDRRVRRHVPRQRPLPERDALLRPGVLPLVGDGGCVGGARQEQGGREADGLEELHFDFDIGFDIGFEFWYFFFFLMW